MSPCVYWFRTALRLHDNPLLLQCAKAPSHLCIYILSKEEIESNCGSNRFSFLFECLEDLNKQLEAFGSRLIVLRGDPVAISGKILASGMSLRV
jgi:cryptochrome